ncbi:hypothetical protein BGW36DRAFT_379602 [Talaromyces proteolyticus]|uniref:Transcription factor domain-containing protein n=1 Tax=Talaromyces proteolyticus TaxID=1131652 RepID=A0AAD4KSN7_9EURO|nr:uncharacterized protein BGW36DRAFT_379602 [Talaromyces proteolyticus]KAH8697873.1 hypothetical protein BGW36DRAFT_379602 [Talaromyces proteolyticus]
MAEERNTPTSRRNFVFVPVTNPGERADAQTRHLIRSHPQLEHNRLYPRTSPRRKNIIELDVTPLLENSQTLVSPRGAHTPSSDVRASTQLLRQDDEDGRNQLIPSLVTALSAHRFDPFVSFDIGLSYRSHQLWDHAYDGTCPKFRALNTIGFLSIARETIAISQMLASSAWHLVHYLRSDNDRGEDVRYSLITTQSLQQKLDNPLTCTTDEVVITVLAMAAYANLIGNISLFKVHADGLSEIIRLRGGEDSLTLPSLRLALFWIDVNGCFRADSSPRFPPPYPQLAAQSNLPTLTMPLEQRELSSEHIFTSITESRVVTFILCKLHEITTIAHHHDTHRAHFAIFSLSPMMHAFFSLPRAAVHDELHLRQRESVRLAGILFLLNLRYRFDDELESGLIYGLKLQDMFQKSGIISEWIKESHSSDARILLLWISTVAACSPCISETLRTSFVNCLSRVIALMGISTFEAFETLIKEFLWCEEAFGSELRHLNRYSLFDS